MQNNKREYTHNDYFELARVRAEVVRALNEEPPNAALLTSRLDRVDALLDRARAELRSAQRELQDVRPLTHEPPASGEGLVWG